MTCSSPALSNRSLPHNRAEDKGERPLEPRAYAGYVDPFGEVGIAQGARLGKELTSGGSRGRWNLPSGNLPSGLVT